MSKTQKKIVDLATKLGGWCMASDVTARGIALTALEALVDKGIFRKEGNTYYIV